MPKRTRFKFYRTEPNLTKVFILGYFYSTNKQVLSMTVNTDSRRLSASKRDGGGGGGGDKTADTVVFTEMWLILDLGVSV